MIIWVAQFLLHAGNQLIGRRITDIFFQCIPIIIPEVGEVETLKWGITGHEFGLLLPAALAFPDLRLTLLNHRRGIFVLRVQLCPPPGVGNGLFLLTIVNAMLVHDYGNNSLRRGKTDKKDAVKLANYGLDHWLTLPRYVPEEDTRLMLKTCYRQYQQYSKVQTMLKNNLISLLDTAFPDANRLFTSPPRADGSEKWVDFVATFWHCECVCGLSKKAFTAKYQKWCRKHGYNFSQDKALDIYASACGRFGVMPKTNTAKLLVEQAISQLQTTSAALAALKQEMQSLAASLPEYPVVMEMFGVGPTLGPQLIAEIGDVRRFHSKKALVAFAGIDAPPYQSGQIDVRSRSISKRGSASLRRTLFLVMGVLLQCAPMDEPVYQFMNKKRSEGKPYRVYMMASANKFLRIYYASVKAYLDSLEHD